MHPSTQKLISFYHSHRRMPSYREIMAFTGYKTTSAVHYFVEKLVAEGIDGKDSRGRLIPKRGLSEIPFVALVQAGFPSPAEEELTDTLSLDDYLIEHREATYLMRAKGESMIEAGIMEGDMLLVERRAKAKPGEIVIALVDGERTMKYLEKRGSAYVLEPANKKFSTIVPKNELVIEAVVKAVIRKY